MSRVWFETVGAAGVLVLSCLGLLEAWTYEGESGLMPRTAMIAVIALSGLWLVESIAEMRRGSPAPASRAPVPLRSALMLAGGCLALVFGMLFIGLFTSAAIFVPALACGLGYRRPLGVILGTVLFVALLIAVFRVLLGVPLPPELLLTFFGA